MIKKVLILVALIFACLIGYKHFFPTVTPKEINQPSTSVSLKKVDTTPEEKLLTPSTYTHEETTKVGNNSTTLIVEDTESCGSNGCFDQKFTQCENAWIIRKTPFETTRFDILGQKDKGCSVKQTALVSMYPTWKDTSMVCTFDNTVSLSVAASVAFKEILEGKVQCTGSLYISMRAIVEGN